MGSSKFEARESAKFEASQRAAANLLSNLGVRVEQLDRLIMEGTDDATFITEVRFKMAGDEFEEVLGIVKTNGPHGKQIAFHYAPSLVEALSGIVNRLNNGTLKFKEDKPYADR